MSDCVDIAVRAQTSINCEMTESSTHSSIRPSGAMNSTGRVPWAIQDKQVRNSSRAQGRALLCDFQVLRFHVFYSSAWHSTKIVAVLHAQKLERSCSCASPTHYFQRWISGSQLILSPAAVARYNALISETPPKRSESAWSRIARLFSISTPRCSLKNLGEIISSGLVGWRENKAHQCSPTRAFLKIVSVFCSECHGQRVLLL